MPGEERMRMIDISGLDVARKSLAGQEKTPSPTPPTSKKKCFSKYYKHDTMCRRHRCVIGALLKK